MRGGGREVHKSMMQHMTPAVGTSLAVAVHIPKNPLASGEEWKEGG